MQYVREIEKCEQNNSIVMVPLINNWSVILVMYIILCLIILLLYNIYVVYHNSDMCMIFQ